MSPKVIVFFALLAVAFAGKPYLGFRIPQFDLTQVVGGNEAPPHAFPFIVSLQWGLLFPNHFCAGSILNENWVLTAGHCIDAIPDFGKFIAVAGKHNIEISESTEQEVAVAKSFVHEKYEGEVGPYDIALIKLKTPLKFTNEVQPIALPDPDSEPTGTATLCGWGSTSQTSIPRMPDKLQYVNLEYINRQVCSDAIKKLTGSSPVDETNICTGPLTGGMAACSGDSGGPLFTKDSSNTVLTGIVSWGIVPCGSAGAPSVYTRVSRFNDWIANKIAEN